jgi:hypothetical protein
VRDVVDEDLRWRDPEGSRELDGALNRFLLRQLRDGRHDPLIPPWNCNSLNATPPS